MSVENSFSVKACVSQGANELRQPIEDILPEILDFSR